MVYPTRYPDFVAVSKYVFVRLKVTFVSNGLQNYLVYTNTVLFIRSGGDSRFAGVMLAVATFGILVTGPTIIGFIPIMVVGTLIFFLGFDLMREALVDTWGRVHRLEYLTVRLPNLPQPLTSLTCSRLL